MGNCMDICTGDRVDVCRAVRKAVRRAVYKAICRAVCRAVHRAIRRAVCKAVCRAVRKAIFKDDCTAIEYMGGYTADCRTFLVISVVW